MKNYLSPSPRRRGFTLIELLVVIAIIAVLAAMGFGAGSMAINKAKKTKAFSDCGGLVQAVQAFYTDYQTLPEVDGIDTGHGVKTETPLMEVLLGFESDNAAGGIQNSKKEKFFSGRESKGKSQERAYDGIFYGPSGNRPELFDPWRKKGTARNERHYYVLVDAIGFGDGTSADEAMKNPFSNQPLFGKLAIAWCTGKDGEFSTGNEKGPKNQDNIYSWTK